MIPKKQTVEIIENEMDAFNEQINQQFSYGGEKYAGSQDKPSREATDDLFDDFSYLWLFGTIAKYVKRFKNTKRERDVLKIGCYMFITWLKRGYHESPQGSDTAIATNVQVKTDNFPKFLEVVSELSKTTNVDTDIQAVYNKIKTVTDKYLHLTMKNNFDDTNPPTVREFIQRGFNYLTEEDLVFVYKVCFLLWNGSFKDKAGQDADVWNEKKK